MKTAETAPRPVAPRTKPIRITIDLEPTQHLDVKRWALEAGGAKLADVVREALQLILVDEQAAETVRTALQQRCTERRTGT